MKQVLQAQHGGQVRVEEVPIPALRAGGVLVRVAWSLVSTGTERAKVELAQKSLLGKARARPRQLQQVLHSLRDQGILDTYRKVSNRLESLQPLGYSCSGQVLAVGSGAEEFKAGDFVTASGAGFANHAEVVFVPKNLCIRIPRAPAARIDVQQADPQRPEERGMESRLSLEEAAFVTPGAIALHGVRQADVRLDEVVAVIGLGLIGLLTVQLLKCAGIRVLGMDLNPERCQLARSLGCDAAESDGNRLLAATRGLTDGRGVDAAILTAATSSNEPLALASRLCRDRGRLVVVGEVGMDVPRGTYYEKELELRICRSYGPGRYDPEYEEKGHDYPVGYVRWTEKRNLETFLHLLAQGKVRVRPLITHRFPVEQAGDAYRMMMEGSELPLGVLLRYPGAEASSEANLSPILTRSSRVIVGKGSAKTSGVAIGLIGAGNFAQDVLIPALRASKLARLRAVATASGLTARSAAERFGFEYCASEPREIFEDPRIRAVMIATRHDQHAALVIEALRSGKPVFVEKPLALNADQLNEIVLAFRQCEEGNPSSPPFLMAGFNRRFAPAICWVKEFFAGQTEPLSLHYRINAGFLPAQHWLHDPEMGGGRFVGEACHFVDLLLYLAGSEIVEIYGLELPSNGQYHQENVAVQLQFANGSVAVLQYLSTGDKTLGKERLEILGGGATAIVDDFRRTTLSRDGRTRHLPRWGEQQDKGHRAEIARFLQAVEQGGPPPIPFQELVLSTLVTFKILESVQSGRPVPMHGYEADLAHTRVADAEDVGGSNAMVANADVPDAAGTSAFQVIE
jgi:predicted dehydrogenase/threonine dehydrogenase-like Zn-dependent dehydrogenase